MASAAQVAANQHNAQLSTGPRTDAGKLAVSRNAVVHGLAAKKFFLSAAEKTLFAHLREALLEHYRPATAHEETLLEELAEARWRYRTARTMEASFLEVVIADQRKADPSITVECAMARVFLDPSLQKRMSLMMRYLASAQRSLDKAGAELERVIALRRAEEQRQAELEAVLAMRGISAPAAQSQPGFPPEPGNRVCSATPPRC